MSPEERPPAPDRQSGPGVTPAGGAARADAARADTPRVGAAPAGADPSRRELISPAALGMARLLRLRRPHGPRPPGQPVRDGLEIPRFGLTIGILLTLLLFLSLLVIFFLPGAVHGAESHGINFDRPTKDWYQGPVRYIISKTEVKAYKSLETELDRQNFIDWFWQRRDIDPSTTRNEFRDRFEQRVFEATRRFNETATPGWKTDMGKIYILMGPPDDEKKDLMPSSGRGTVIWVYRKSPIPGEGANLVVGFARDPSGTFRLSTSPTIDSDVARNLQFARTKITIDDQILIPGLDPAMLAAGAPLNQGEIATMMLYGELQKLPANEEAMFKSLVNTREYFGSIPAESQVNYYQGTDGKTFATITVGIKSSAVQYRSQAGKERPDLSVFGKLINRRNTDDVYPLASDSNFVESQENAEAGPSDMLVFQATGAFKPGDYELVLGMQDRVSKRVSSYRKNVVIPDTTTKDLSLSTIAVAGTLDPVDYRASTGKPFYIGKFRLVPRPDSSFRKGDELNLYFQVYNAAPDPATGTPKLDIYYGFQFRKDDGSYADVGTYAVKGSGAPVQGYAVPLDKWPAGVYQVKLTVNDTVAGKSVSSSIQFSVLP